LLIISSIGVNIARYPQVGRAIEPAAGATDTAGSSQSASTAQSIEKLGADQLPIKPEVTAAATNEKRPEVSAGEPRADRVAPTAPQQTRPTPNQVEKGVPIVDVQPIMPARDNQPGNSESPSGRDQVQRLPPIESRDQAAFENGTAVDGINYSSTATP
jgi:hypothetical protein